MARRIRSSRRPPRRAGRGAGFSWNPPSAFPVPGKRPKFNTAVAVVSNPERDSAAAMGPAATFAEGPSSITGRETSRCKGAHMRMRIRGGVAGGSIALAVLCGAIAVGGAKAARGAAEKSLDGYWLSEGYGYFAEFQGVGLQLYEITPISCLPAASLKRQAEQRDPRGARYVPEEDSDPMFLSPGPAADSEWFHVPDAASSMLFHRTAQRPEDFARKTPNDPVTNFEILWQ